MLGTRQVGAVNKRGSFLGLLPNTSQAFASSGSSTDITVVVVDIPHGIRFYLTLICSDEALPHRSSTPSFPHTKNSFCPFSKQMGKFNSAGFCQEHQLSMQLVWNIYLRSYHTRVIVCCMSYVVRRGSCRDIFPQQRPSLPS